MNIAKAKVQRLLDVASSAMGELDRLEKVNANLLAALKRWETYAANNLWTDADFHDADGTGWISETRTAVARAEGRADA